MSMGAIEGFVAADEDIDGAFMLSVLGMDGLSPATDLEADSGLPVVSVVGMFVVVGMTGSSVTGDFTKWLCSPAVTGAAPGMEFSEDGSPV